MKNNQASLFLYRVFSGVLIGGGAILPGVSGGVLCVVFGIYRALMEFLSRILTHPVQALKKHFGLFLPVGIGCALGFIGFAKVVGGLFERFEYQMLFLFIGLILGTVPMLLKTARRGRKTSEKQDWAALCAAFAVLLAVLLIVQKAQKMQLALTPVTAFISGIIWGFSLVVPGLSSSSLLIFMGLYKDIMTAVGAVDLGIILPLLLGIAAVALGCAKLVDTLFDRKFSLASHAVVGLVVASTLTIIPPVPSVTAGMAGAAFAAVGFIAALQLDKWQATVEKA